MWVLDYRVWLAQYRLSSSESYALGYDLKLYWAAYHAVVTGGHPYGAGFVYPPSNLLLSFPLGYIPIQSLLHPVLVLSILLLVGSVMVAAEAIGRRWWGLSSALGVWFLKAGLLVPSSLVLLNVSLLIAFGLALTLWLLSRDRWDMAAVVLGLTFCMKPVLLPALLVFVLARRWRPLVLAVGIPMVLNLLALTVIPHANQVWSNISQLFSGNGPGFVPYNATLSAVGTTNHWPMIMTEGLRLFALITAGVVAWAGWRRSPSTGLRNVTTVSAAFLGLYLCGSLTEDHYMFVFIPLAMSIAAPGSAMRLPTAWLGIAWISYYLALPAGWFGFTTLPAANSTMEVFGMMLVLVSMAVMLLVGQRTRRANSRELDFDSSG